MSGGGSVYTFLGKEDPGVGMLDFGPRYYNAVLGRFFSPDPILFGDSPYSYAAGNPVMLYDPTGMYYVPPPPPTYDSPDYLARLAATGHADEAVLGPGTYMVDGSIVAIGDYSPSALLEALPSGSDAYRAAKRRDDLACMRADYEFRRRESEATAQKALSYGAEQRARQAATQQQRNGNGGIPQPNNGPGGSGPLGPFAGIKRPGGGTMLMEYGAPEGVNGSGSSEVQAGLGPRQIASGVKWLAKLATDRMEPGGAGAQLDLLHVLLK